MTRRNQKAAILLVVALAVGTMTSGTALAGMGQGNRTPPINHETPVTGSIQSAPVQEDQSSNLLVDVLVRSFLFFWMI